jgi:hypothetical protein
LAASRWPSHYRRTLERRRKVRVAAVDPSSRPRKEKAPGASFGAATAARAPGPGHRNLT